MNWNQWQVTAYTGKNRDRNLGTSFVRADSEEHARELGRKALRLIGVRGSFRVSASPYWPPRDLAFWGFVKEVK